MAPNPTQQASAQAKDTSTPDPTRTGLNDPTSRPSQSSSPATQRTASWVQNQSSHFPSRLLNSAPGNNISGSMGTRTQESQDYPSQTEKETQAEDGKSRTEGGKSSGGEKVFDGRKTSGGGRNATEESGQTKTKMRTKMEQKVAFIGSWMDDA